MEQLFEILKVVVLGIIQGITEWLPISSTGHMILADTFLQLNQPKDFMDMFYVVIQLGSILAVVVLYFHKLNPFALSKTRSERQATFQLWLKVIAAILPIGVIGLLVDDWVTEHFYTPMVIAVALAIIGECGHTYGIPFTVQLRSSFGFTGVKIPGVLRGLPAIVWFGYQSWVCAGAINSCTSILFGFDNLPVVYGLFTLVQVLLAIKGFEGIKWMENISCIFILVILAYMLYVVNTEFSTEIGDVFSGIEGTWGMPFWAATTSFLGIYSTMIINASDYSRNATDDIKPVKAASIYTIAILPVTLFMGLGVLSVVVMPWKLVTAESAAGLNLFTQFYSAFLGPIFAVMAVDFYILRKKKLDLNRMYDKNGPYKGMNWAAIIAIVIGSICSLIIMELSWYVSLIPTGVIYYFLMKKMKSAEGFRVGTIFEDEK